MQVINTNLQYRNSLVPLNLDKVLFLVIHHPDAQTASPEEIHAWHLANGWSGFGYNEYIRKDGTVYIGRGDNIGAQCANMNSKSYGICCEGNYDIEQSMPTAQFDALVERVKHHKARLKNLVVLGPHSKYYPTSCPGKFFPFIKLIESLTSSYDPLNDSVNILKSSGIIQSPDYWNSNAIAGKNVNGEYVGTLIKNMAKKLKGG